MDIDFLISRIDFFDLCIAPFVYCVQAINMLTYVIDYQLILVCLWHTFYHFCYL